MYEKYTLQGRTALKSRLSRASASTHPSGPLRVLWPQSSPGSVASQVLTCTLLGAALPEAGQFPYGPLLFLSNTKLIFHIRHHISLKVKMEINCRF